MMYKVKAPLGSVVVSKEIMTEKELREFMPQLVQDSEQADTWREKAAKDPIEEVIGYLETASFVVEKID